MVHLKVGPTRSTLAPYSPNRDDRPFHVDSPNFTGNVLVRIAKFHSAVTKDAPHTSPYFKGRQRKYSITASGRFKATNPASPDGKWTANDLYCWIEMERPLRLPPKIITAAGLSFIHFFDPTFITEGIFKQSPYAGTPVFATFNLIRLDPAPPPPLPAPEPEVTSENSDENLSVTDTHVNVPSPAMSESSSLDPAEAEQSRHLSEEALHAAADELGVTPSQLLTIGRTYIEEAALESPLLDPASRVPGVSTPQLLELPPPAAPASPMVAATSYEDSPPALRPSLKPQSSPGSDILAPRPLHKNNSLLSVHGLKRTSSTVSIPASGPATPSQSQPLPLPPWPYSTTNFEVQEHFAGTLPPAIDTVKKRRKYFSNEAVRRGYVLDPDTVYTFEMYDSYIDMNRFIINVGFDVGGRSLFGDKQKVRIVFGDAHRKNVFFCIYLDPEDF